MPLSRIGKIQLPFFWDWVVEISISGWTEPRNLMAFAIRFWKTRSSCKQIWKINQISHRTFLVEIPLEGSTNHWRHLFARINGWYQPLCSFNNSSTDAGIVSFLLSRACALRIIWSYPLPPSMLAHECLSTTGRRQSEIVFGSYRSRIALKAVIQ